MFKKLLPYLKIIVIVVIIRLFILTPIRVIGDSMDTTLKNKEVMILIKFTKYFGGIDRNDIVVIDTDEEEIIKRVIGLPNETVECRNGIIYINGKQLKKDYGENKTEDFELIKLKSDEYYVLGDNRAISKDSRYIGPIKKKDIMGEANLVLYPFTKIRIAH